ncbi:glycosyltransferase family 2 protein [Nitrosospira sp. Nsp1]|uniref:glycosyltransferase family 2 protein n=1 Tax=Nitrosospira sp. Nsp1 TaxID=136547 RepID=UPI0008865D04|nr:glycosyltransferase family 2 protein [Nitrosospira sp. Nsp1]SCX49241.1 Glycosyl transferase family 2 [Nitrosospira sp. Nsp1]
MKIVAILASYNEQKFIRACLEHYLQQGIKVYLLDNDSTDKTLDIAREYLGRNLIGIERIPRHGMYQWQKILMRKEELADEIEADWLMHADPDEIRVAPTSAYTLAEAIADVDRKGYNAVNFMEYTFLPVRESPDHDNAEFQETMRWYYPFAQRHPHRLNAWKKQSRRWPGTKAFLSELARNHRPAPSVNLRDTGGHVVQFPGIHPYPVDFKLKHYIVLSLEHAIQKYVKKSFDPKEIAGSHGWRATAKEHEFLLPSQSQMRLYTSDDELDATNPLKEHLLVQQ